MTLSRTALSAMAAMATFTALVVPQHATAQTAKIDPAPVLVRNVDEPGRNPFQTNQTLTAYILSTSANVPTPAGKIAVIEHVSIFGLASSGAVTYAGLDCFNGVGHVAHFLALTQQGSADGNTYYAASQPIKCYANSGGLQFWVYSSHYPSVGATWTLGVSGYLL